MSSQNIGAKMILILVVIVTANCYCSGTFTGSYTPCTFQYEYQDINCTVFQFDNCSWTECVSYVTVGNDTYCVDWQTFYDTSWGSCTSRCCDSSKDYPYTYDSLPACESDRKALTIKIIIIIFSVVGGILVIVGLVCLICRCMGAISGCCQAIRDCFRFICESCLFVWTCRCFRSSSDTFTKPQDHHQVQIQLTLKEFNTWQTENVRNQKLNDSCCICLEPGSSLQLECGHIYHRQCIISYTNKKPECALCRSTSINNIRIYCERCFSKYLETNLTNHRNQLNTNTQICQSCKTLQKTLQY